MADRSWSKKSTSPTLARTRSRSATSRAAFGKEVTHVKEGDHVIRTWVPRSPISGLPVSKPTGATFHGRPLIADGDVYTWSQDMVTFAEKVVPMAPPDPIDITCLVGCAVLTGAGSVLHTANVGLGQSVAVFGAGGVGLSAIGAAAIAGADPIIAVDLVERKLEFAREFGATHRVNASNTGIPVSDVSIDLNAILLYQRHYCGSLGAAEPAPTSRSSWSGCVRASSR